MVDVINTALVVVSSAAFLAAVYFTYKLSQETRGGKYWLAFLVAAIGLGIHEWLKIADLVFHIQQDLWNTLIEGGVVLGAIALAYGAYGIQQSVKELKQRARG